MTLAHDEHLLESFLCVQYPFSRLLVTNVKTLELRKRRLGKKFAGVATRLFVNESKSKRAKFKSRAVEKPLQGRAPGHVIGAITLLGTWLDLTQVALTYDIARAAMLTLPDLKAAVVAGYKYAWQIAPMSGTELPESVEGKFWAKNLPKGGRISTLRGGGQDSRVYF